MECLLLVEEEEDGFVFHVENTADDVANVDLCLVRRFLYI